MSKRSNLISKNSRNFYEIHYLRTPIHVFWIKLTRRGVRVAERASLESLCTAMYRGFESRPLRFRVLLQSRSRYSRARFQCLVQKSKIGQLFLGFDDRGSIAETT